MLSSNRRHTFMVLQPTKSTNVFRFHHWKEIRPHTMPTKCMLNNGKIYVIVIKTYRWQLIFQAHRKKNTSKRKRQISGCVVRFVLLVVRLQHIARCTQTHMRPSIVSFCESIEHRLVVPVPVVLYQFLVFGSFIICAAQCAYCGHIRYMRECVSSFIVLHFVRAPNERTSSHRRQHQNESFLLLQCVYSRAPFSNRFSSDIASLSFSLHFLEII